jgi:uncharacterized membrane protein
MTDPAGLEESDSPPTPPRRLRRYLVTGLLIWVPLVITLWVLDLIVGTMDRSLELLPAALHPQNLFGFRIPGLGALLTVLVVLLTGLAGSNIIGQRAVILWERMLSRIPFVKSIYNSVKQVSDTLFAPSGQAFRKALLVEWPRQGVWTIAFLTGKPGGDVAQHLPPDCVSVYVPTTPNPTGGYFVIVPRASVVELEMTVDEALKYIISMGVVAPPPAKPRAAPKPRVRPRAADVPSVPPQPTAEPEAPKPPLTATPAADNT